MHNLKHSMHSKDSYRLVNASYESLPNSQSQTTWTIRFEIEKRGFCGRHLHLVRSAKFQQFCNSSAIVSLCLFVVCTRQHFLKTGLRRWKRLLCTSAACVAWSRDECGAQRLLHILLVRAIPKVGFERRRLGDDLAIVVPHLQTCSGKLMAIAVICISRLPRVPRMKYLCLKRGEKLRYVMASWFLRFHKWFLAIRGSCSKSF